MTTIDSHDWADSANILISPKSSRLMFLQWTARVARVSQSTESVLQMVQSAVV